jgi:hypothetical protein
MERQAWIDLALYAWSVPSLHNPVWTKSPQIDLVSVEREGVEVLFEQAHRPRPKLTGEIGKVMLDAL